MLKRLTSVKEYLDFINEANHAPSFSGPMLSSEAQIRCNLLDAPDKPTNRIRGVFEGAELVDHICLPLFVPPGQNFFRILNQAFLNLLTRSCILRSNSSSV